jgi:soluble lytic murein transglycosylase-like protein
VTPSWLKKWDKRILEISREAAIRHQLDPHWVLAVIQTESAGFPHAMRYETGWSYFCRPEFYADRLAITVDTERQMQKFSYGLMQIMGSVAREYGFGDSLALLVDPFRATEYGCRHLKNFRRRYPLGRDWIAAYNAGSPRKNPDGTYTNEAYVKKVVGFWSDLADT